jgi:hypothetical protein
MRTAAAPPAAKARQPKRASQSAPAKARQPKRASQSAPAKARRPKCRGSGSSRRQRVAANAPRPPPTRQCKRASDARGPRRALTSSNLGSGPTRQAPKRCPGEAALRVPACRVLPTRDAPFGPSTGRQALATARSGSGQRLAAWRDRTTSEHQEITEAARGLGHGSIAGRRHCRAAGVPRARMEGPQP